MLHYQAAGVGIVGGWNKSTAAVKALTAEDMKLLKRLV